MHLHHLREIMRTLLLLLVSLAVLPGRVHAQRERLVLRTYGVNDGLPSQEVRSVVRDSLGLVWVGTATGLAVSSGDAFVNAERAFIITFPPSPISQIAVHAREGGLLVSGAQGTAVSVSFVRQDPYRKGYHWKSLFSEIPDNVIATWNFTSIFRTRMKEVLIGTKGHGVWTRVDTGKVMDAYSFMHAELRKVGEGLTVTAIVEDSSGTVWVGTNKGLFTYLDASLLQVPARLSELRHSPIRTLTVARDGSLWISADGRGLFHVQAGIAVHPRKIAGIPGAAVTSISCSPNGDVWCATSSGGLVRLRNGKISVFTRSDGLPTNAFHCVHADDDGLVWAGSSEGLTKILPESYLLYSETDGLPRGAFFGVTKAPNGDLWFSGTGALVRMRGSAIRSWKTQSSIGNLPLLKPVVDSQGQVWMLSARGVVRFGGNTFTLFADSLIDELYASVCRLKFHPQGGIVLLTPTSLRRFRNGATTTILKGERLQDFVFDRAGNIWAYSFPAVWKVALNDSVTPLGDIGFPVNITTGHDDSVFVLNRLKGFQSQYELEHMDSVSARDMNDDKSIKTRGYVVDGMVTKSGRRIITTTIAVTEQLVGDDRLKFLASTENMAILSPLYERSDGSILLFTVTSKNLGFYHLDLNKGSLIKQPLLNSSIIREMRAGPLGIYRVGGSSLVKGLQLLTEDSSGVLWAATPVGIMSFPPSGLHSPVPCSFNDPGWFDLEGALGGCQDHSSVLEGDVVRCTLDRDSAVWQWQALCAANPPAQGRERPLNIAGRPRKRITYGKDTSSRYAPRRVPTDKRIRLCGPFTTCIRGWGGFLRFSAGRESCRHCPRRRLRTWYHRRNDRRHGPYLAAFCKLSTRRSRADIERGQRTPASGYQPQCVCCDVLRCS